MNFDTELKGFTILNKKCKKDITMRIFLYVVVYRVPSTDRLDQCFSNFL